MQGGFYYEFSSNFLNKPIEMPFPKLGVRFLTFGHITIIDILSRRKDDKYG